jgi:CO/xanthine dehydrogenase FAD-binding subunit
MRLQDCLCHSPKGICRSINTPMAAEEELDLRTFTYAAPNTVPEAVALMAEAKGITRALAGGTDLITQLREGRREADLVVDLKQIPALQELRFDPGTGLRIGAAVPWVRIQESADVKAHYPVLTFVSTLIGSYQIQCRASLGGNLCNASPSADGIPPLITLGATAVIAGPRGERSLPVEVFCTGPGKHVLEQGEFLVAIEIPIPPARSGAAYQRFIPRNEMDIAVVGVGSYLELDAEGRTTRAGIALAAVAPVPLRVPAAEAVLQGQFPTEELFAQAGAIAAAACSPISDVRGSADYRRHLVGVLTRRTLVDALDLAKGGN